MNPSALIHQGSLAIDLNGSSNLLHWSFIEISVANLIVIAVMVVIFGAALLIRFPHGKGADLPPSPADAGGGETSGADPTAVAAAAEPGDAGMWTARTRTRIGKMLPPKKRLPDRQPAYV